MLQRTPTIIALAIALSTVGLLPTATTQGPQPIVVDDNADECPDADEASIQAAVDAASDGDRIEVCAGDYAEHVEISTNVALTARSQDAVIQASGADHIVTVSGQDTEAVVDGFSIQGPQNGLVAGVAVVDGAHAVVRDNAIDSVHDDPLGGAQHGVGVLVGDLWYADDPGTGSAEIVSNSITDSQKSAVVVTGDGSEATIADNDIQCSGEAANDVIAQDAIQLWQSASADVVGNSITECFQVFFGANRGVGIHVSNGVHDTTIADNTIEGTQTGIAMMNYAGFAAGDDERVENLVIAGNTITGVDGAIYLGGSGDDITVTGNDVSGADDSDNLAIFVGPDFWISAPDMTNVQVTDNHVHDSTQGLYVTASADETQAHGNTIEDNDVALLNLDSEPVDARLNYWGSPTGPSHDSNPAPGAGGTVDGPAETLPFCPIPCSPSSIPPV